MLRYARPCNIVGYVIVYFYTLLLTVVNSNCSQLSTYRRFVGLINRYRYREKVKSSLFLALKPEIWWHQSQWFSWEPITSQISCTSISVRSGCDKRYLGGLYRSAVPAQKYSPKRRSATFRHRDHVHHSTTPPRV